MEVRDPTIAQAKTRLAELAPDHRAKDALLTPLVSASPYLARFLIAHPEALSDLEELPPPRDRAGWLAVLEAQAPLTEPEAAFIGRLRMARYRAFVQLAVRELVTGDPLATGVELSALAEAAVEHALSYARALIDARFGRPLLAGGGICESVVIAMGQLGSGELDFSTDIDLLYAYASDQGETDGARGLGTMVGLHVYHARLFAKVTQLLSEPGETGAAFRVGLDQRPEGRTGPLCNSADALERYYESFGHDAERLAWIKARPIAGDLALGERIIGSLEPFVFRRNLDLTFAEDLEALKRRIDRSSARLGQKPGFSVRLGRGGLREIEFFVQALQLAWGGRLPDLRARDTTTALRRLALAGLVDQSEADALAEAYRFLKRTEHLVQLEDDKKAHMLPAHRDHRSRIAAVLLPGDTDLVPRFEAALAEHRKRVRTAFEGVVAGSEADGEMRELAAAAPSSGEPATSETGALADPRLSTALDPEADPEARDDALRALGFAWPEPARNRLDVLARRPDSPFHPRHAAGGAHNPLARLAGRILLAVSQTPDPDQGLSHVDSLLRAIRHRHAALEQLDRDPRRLTALANLFGTSHFLSRLLVRSPGLLDRLVLDGKEPLERSRTDMTRLLAAELALTGDEVSVEAFLTAARRFQVAEVLRIGFFDLAGLIEDPAGQLTDLAEVIVAGLADAVRAEHAARMAKRPEDVSPLTVVALGHFGARELGYRSELELLFLVSDDAEPMLALRMSRAVVTALSVSTVEGSLYQLDSRQRPSGTHGPLSVTTSRWRAHHLEAADADPAAADWEREALSHARVIGPTFDPRAAEAVAEVAAHVRAALARMPGALTQQDPDAPGGGDLSALDESRRFLRRLDNRLALVQESGADSLVLLGRNPAAWSDSDRNHMRRLALRMGYGGIGARDDNEVAKTLYNDVQRHRRVVAELTAKLAATSPP